MKALSRSTRKPFSLRPAPIVPAQAADLTSVNEAARTALADQLRDAAAALEGVEVQSEFLQGDPGATLVAQSESLDLLVVGSRGYGPLRSVLLGGVSGHLIHTARCPVLVCAAQTP